MTGKLCLLMAALLPIAGAAAALTEVDAVRIGREADVTGLRALIGQRNQALLYRASASWDFGAARELAPALEGLIVEHYTDAVIQRPLLGLLAKSLDRFERYPKYRSRALFELLYADLKAGRDTLHYAIRIIATELAVESELVAMLSELDPAAANELVMFLGARKYAPAVPALQALQARVPHERNTNQMIERVDWALLQIGTPAAVQAVLERLRTLGRNRTEAAGYEIWHILNYVGQLPIGSPPAYTELAAALPAELNESAWGGLIQLIASRKEAAGVPQLLRAITQSPKAEEAVDALLAIGKPADWRAGIAALRESRLPAGRTAQLHKKLDSALVDPAGFVARRDQYDSERLYVAEKRRLAAFKATHPARYGAEMRALLERQESRAPSEALMKEYLALGSFLRFTLHRPDDAMAAYEAASRVRPQDSFDLAAIAMADVQRFDKRDARRASEQYRRVLVSYRAPPQSQDAALSAGFRRWIEQEIAYLERGRRFNGALGPAEMQTAFFWLALGTLHEPIHPPPEPQALVRLPASQLQLARVYPAMLELAPQEMLRFFEKHDPAGYLTAGLLATALAREPSPYVKAAAEQFFRTRGIRAPFAAGGDVRYASPENTWAAFLSAAKKGDARAMLECFTFGMQAKLQPLFTRMSADERRQMGTSFVAFSMQEASGNYREAAIVRQQNDRRMAGFVTFVNEGGSWKIDSM